jgi:hypothetical protein
MSAPDHATLPISFEIEPLGTLQLVRRNEFELAFFDGDEFRLP